MEFRILGSLEVLNSDGRSLQVPGPKTRLLLARLLLDAGSVVSVDRLVDAMWGEDPPERAAKTLQTYVLQLRKVLEPRRPKGTSGKLLLRREPGYVLDVKPEQVDALRFQRLVAEGRQAVARFEPERGSQILAEALALWRGAALAEFTDEPFARAEAARLEDLRLSVIEDRIEADLVLGRHTSLVAEIDRLVHRHPLRERLWAQLMVALYRSGRQAEALRAFQRARTTLRDELGIDPGPELRRLEASILVQDPALDLHLPIGRPDDLPRALEALGGLLFGRTEELDRLIALWQQAGEGRGSVGLVTGPEGIGKTRLVAEVGCRAFEEGSVVLYGRGFGPGATLQPFAEALAGVGSSPQALLGSVEEPDPERFASALVAFLRRRAGARPAVVVLDDLDRADDVSVEALRALAEACRSARLLVVGIARDRTGLSQRMAPTRPRSDSEGPTLVELGPLGNKEVAAIASCYLGERGSDLVSPLLDHACGNPLRVHQEAARLARSLASRRIGEASGEAARARRGLRAVHGDIVGGVLELQRLRAEPGRAGRASQDPGTARSQSPDRVICPYKGLARFEVSDADYFFGREELVAETVARVVGSAFLAVVGPSGSGKSSLVRAGLLPALRDGVLPETERWLQLVMSPGAHPVRELVRRLASVEGDRPDGNSALAAINRTCSALRKESGLLLFVDQLEEVFTACEDDDEREEFLAALVSVALRPEGAVTVVVTMRSDYYGQAAADPHFAGVLPTNQVLVGPLPEEKLLRVVELPAQRAGLKLEVGLAAAMVADVVGEPGGLPLLSTALVEAWEHRRGRALALAAYNERGGVRGAVGRLAEAAYGRLTPGEQGAAPVVLPQLANWEGGSLVRRRVAAMELSGAHPHASGLIAALIDRRLLTTHDEVVEVAHEALLREWPRLRSWLEEGAEQQRVREHLRRAAHEWNQRGNDPAELYRGARLVAALQWEAANRDQLEDLERAFIDESRAAAERDEREAQRRLAHQGKVNRRLRVLVAAFAGALGIAVVAGTVAFVQRERASEQALVARSRGLGAQSLADGELDRALLLALEAIELDESVETRSALLANLLRSPQATGVLSGGGNRLQHLALTPDGTFLAASDNRGKTYLWELSSRRRVDPPLDTGPATTTGLAFSHDGTTLATTTGAAVGQGGQVLLWDHRTRQRRGEPLEGLGSIAHSVAYSGDGARLAAADSRGGIIVWDLKTREVVFASLPKQGANTYVSLDWHGGLLVSSNTDSGALTIWDVDNETPLRSIPGVTFAHALSPDGALVASATPDATVVVHDVATGARRTTLVGHSAPVLRLAFSSDGRSLASASDDRTAIVWDLPTGTKREVLRGHAGRVLAPVFSPDGKTLYTSGLDDRVFIWDLTGERRLGRVGAGAIAEGRRSNRTPPLALRPDLAVLAASRDERSVMLRSIPGGQPIGRPFGGEHGRLNRLAFSGDGSMLATTADDGTAPIWNVATHEVVARLEAGHEGAVTAVAFAPAGGLVATAGGDGKVVVWDLATSKAVGSPLDAGRPERGPAAHLLNVAFSPDGRWLAATGGLGDVALWYLPDRSPRHLPADTTESIAVAFSPNSRTIATGGQDGKVRIWDLRSGEPVGSALEGHAGFVNSAAYDSLGVLLATGGTDGAVILWDVQTRTQLGSPLPGPVQTGSARSVVRFAPGGREVGVAYDDGQILVWDIDPASWRKRACSIAGRNLTRDEWRKIHGGRPYRATCSQWPPEA